MNDDLEAVHNEFPAIAEQAFPDDDVNWTIKVVIVKVPYYCVETEPVPPTVGYPRFRFVLAREVGPSFVDVACFCLNGGKWQLLYTTPETSSNWEALGFDAVDGMG